MSQTNPTSFEPVLLNLADNQDYGILVNALSDYAGQLEHEAENDEIEARFNDRPALQAEGLRVEAQRARAIADDIERQLDANAVARRHN